MSCAADAAGVSKGSDRLGAARVLFRTALLTALLAAGTVASDVLLRAGSPVEGPKAAVGALHLSSLALVPSGRPLRLPGRGQGIVDLRHDFTLSQPAPDASGMLLPAAGAGAAAEMRR